MLESIFITPTAIQHLAMPPMIAQNISKSSSFPSSSNITPNSQVRFSISKVAISGNKIFSLTEITNITQRIEGKTVTLAEIHRTTDAITQLYVNKGHITSYANVDEQDIKNGIVHIRIIEGGIEQPIQITGNPRLDDTYIRRRLSAATQTPIPATDLEEQLRLLRLDPNLKAIEAVLYPGTEPGKSRLNVRVKEADSFYGGTSTDNYSSPAIGSERYNSSIGLRNLTGLGDDLNFSYSRTTSGGSNTYDLNYRIPISPQNGTLQLRYAPSNYRITDKTIKSLYPGINFQGNSELYEISLRQPVLRSLRQELGLSLSYALQNGESYITGTDLFNTSNRTHTLKFSQDYLARDTQGTWNLRSQFNLGLNRSNATTETDNSFFSWLGQMQRTQRLNDNNFLIAQLDLQLSPSSLPPSQQFLIGGGQSIRGYRQNARSGDNGIRLSLENRMAISRNKNGNPTLQLAPFLDLGTTWNTKTPNSQNFLSSGGLGLIWQPVERATLRLDYALPFRSLKERDNNLQDRSLYFSLNYHL